MKVNNCIPSPREVDAGVSGKKAGAGGSGSLEGRALRAGVFPQFSAGPEASPTTCCLRVKTSCFMAPPGKLRGTRLAPPTPRPLRLAPPPARVPIRSCPAAPPSGGCALTRPALHRSNMALPASVRRLGLRVSGLRAGGLGAPRGVRSRTSRPSAGAGVQPGAARRLARPAHLRGLRQGECSGPPRGLGGCGGALGTAAPRRPFCS